MKRLAAVAVIPLFAGFLYAQEQTTTTETKTTTSNMNGTLVDAGCYKTHSEHSESSTSNPDANTTQSQSTHTTSESVQCPVTSTTTTFGLITPQGKYMTFDEPGNTKIVEVVKTNKKWRKYMESHQPLEVQVVGRPEGDTVVLQEIR
jgi:hypothetical protein